MNHYYARNIFTFQKTSHDVLITLPDAGPDHIRLCSERHGSSPEHVLSILASMYAIKAE